MSGFKKLFTTLKAVGDHPLYRRRKLVAMTSFIWSQIAARAQRGDVSVKFPDATRLIVAPRVKGAAHYLFPGLCEFEEMSFVMHFLRANDLFADIGANIGAYTVLAAGVAKAQVVAYEPNPRTFSQLRQNIAINHIDTQVRAVNAAVGRTAAKLRLTDDLGTENYVMPEGNMGIEVPVWPLDAHLEGKIPKLLKIDVEGFETEAFAGATQLLAAPALQAMIVERNDSGARYGFDEGMLHRTIRNAGFSPFAYEPFTRKLFPLPSEARGNLIYLRDHVRAEQLVGSAVGYKFKGVKV